MHQNTDGLTCQIIEAGSRSLKIGSWSVLILQTNNNNSATNFSRIEKVATLAGTPPTITFTF